MPQVLRIQGLGNSDADVSPRKSLPPVAVLM
jgi:hypothetical protein